MINTFNELSAPPSLAASRAVRRTALLAALVFVQAPALAASGRDGGPQLGCGSVTDGHGATISGREGGVSISTRLHGNCASGGVEASGHEISSAPGREPAAKSEGATARIIEPARVPIVSGRVRPAAETAETPSALSGHLGRASAAAATGGALIWFLQSSLWGSLLMLGVPMWRRIDLLPVVGQAGDLEQSRPPEAENARKESALAKDTGQAPRPIDDNRGLPA